MEKLFIVMPAYNEEENIEDVVRNWYRLLEGKEDGSRLVVADAGSKDRTHCILENLKKELPCVEILSNTNRQHGPKVIALYKYAIAHGADYIFQTDSDGQTNPEEFSGFWNMRNSYSGIFGYRNARGDGPIRACVEKVVCLLVRVYFGVKIPDANAPFRLMKAETVAKYIKKLPEDYNIPNIMMTTYFVFYGESSFFKTISFKQRQGGVNSINVIKIVKIGLNALKDFRRLKKDM